MQLGWVLFMSNMLHKMKYWRLYFQDKNLITMNCFCKEKLKVVTMRVNVTKNSFSI